MKRKYMLRIKILIAMICLPFLLSSCSKYPGGKDTVLSGGDGRFQVVHGYTFSDDLSNGESKYFLIDMEKDGDIDSDVREYYDDKRKEKLYLICGTGYIVIDYKTCSYEQHKEIDDFAQTDQTVFHDETNFATFGQR